MATITEIAKELHNLAKQLQIVRRRLRTKTKQAELESKIAKILKTNTSIPPDKIKETIDPKLHFYGVDDLKWALEFYNEEKLAKALSRQIDQEKRQTNKIKIVSYYNTIDSSGEEVDSGDHEERSNFDSIYEILEYLEGAGVFEHSSSSFDSTGWYVSTDTENYQTGESTRETYHIKYATIPQKKEIYESAKMWFL
jgi:hypothetical protein